MKDMYNKHEREIEALYCLDDIQDVLTDIRGAINREEHVPADLLERLGHTTNEAKTAIENIDPEDDS